MFKQWRKKERRQQQIKNTNINFSSDSGGTVWNENNIICKWEFRCFFFIFLWLFWCMVKTNLYNIVIEIRINEITSNTYDHSIRRPLGKHSTAQAKTRIVLTGAIFKLFHRNPFMHDIFDIPKLLSVKNMLIDWRPNSA